MLAVLQTFYHFHLTFRYINEFFRQSDMASGNISAALSCDIRNIFWGSLTARMMRFKSPSTAKFRSCFSNAIQNRTRWKQCELNMTQTCRTRYTATVVKTVRLRMSRVLEIMKRDPKVKVLHLVRDPRPVLLSRTKFFHINPNKFHMMATELCDSYKADISASKLLPKSRYRLFRYEDIVLHPELSVKLMYNFTGLVLSTKALQQIIAKELSTNRRTVSLNQTILSETWRSRMSLKDVNVFSKACEEVLSVLGYRMHFDSEATLRNISVPVVERQTLKQDK